MATTNKKRVLFVCIHNSGRSQMAEAFLNALAGERFEAESAGFEPTAVHPLVIEVMKEAGLDLSRQKSKNVFDFYRQGRLYDYVITVCDKSTEEKCPVFPGISRRIHWPFPDPEKLDGSREENLVTLGIIRDRIRSRILEWIEQV